MEFLLTTLSSSPILCYTDNKKAVLCQTYVSQYAIGVTLTWIRDGNKKVVSCFLRGLNYIQMNYSANYPELLGMIGPLRRFLSYVEGADFEIVTDNKVLKYFIC